MAQPELGREEWVLMRRLQHPAFVFPDEQSVESFRSWRRTAAYIDRLDPDTLVLVDSVLGFPLSVFGQHRERLAITSDRDFETLVQEPRGRVSHLLVPRPYCEPGTACRVHADQLVRTYPDLWEHGAPWATLEAEFGGQHEWRLYRILPPEAGT